MAHSLKARSLLKYALASFFANWRISFFPCTIFQANDPHSTNVHTHDTTDSHSKKHKVAQSSSSTVTAIASQRDPESKLAVARDKFGGFLVDKPLRLRIVSISCDSISLEWNSPEYEVDKYQVFMRPKVHSNWYLIYQGMNRNYCVPNLLANTPYLFRARYQCLYGLSPYNTPPKKCKTDSNNNSKTSQGSHSEVHPPIMSNIQIAARQKELKKQQRKNRKENKKQREELEAKRRKRDLENKRKKEAANKRKKIKARQKATKRRKELMEKREEEKKKKEHEKSKLYEQALVERLKQLQMQKVFVLNVYV